MFLKKKGAILQISGHQDFCLLILLRQIKHNGFSKFLAMIFL